MINRDGSGPRPWQEPLTPEAIAKLQVEFAAKKAWIESFWGRTAAEVRPWSR